MLEVRYIEATGVITGWAGSPGHEGGHLRAKSGEKIIVIDCPTPKYPPDHYLIVAGQLELINPPTPARDLVTEMNDLKARVEELEK